MTSSPSVCTLDDTTNAAARIMWERDCGAAPVVDRSGRVVGIVTDRDICIAAYFQGEPLSNIRVSDVMSRELCTCRPEDPVTSAEHLMREHQVRRLPVVTDGMTLVGILSLSDLAQAVPSRTDGRQPPESQELLQVVSAVSEPRTSIP
ncbi:MAG: CBS domain-containing protein [Vicinamibacterales bacterium]